jgi:ketosteroid isomerase-like protein
VWYDTKMSDEAASLARKFADAVTRQDRDGWVAAFHPDFEGYSGLVTVEERTPYHGLEGAGAWFDNLMEVYSELQADHEQTIEVGEHSLSLIRVEYVGRSSGVTLEAALAWVAEIRDGRYVFAHSHFEVGEGFEEMGRRIGQRAR